MTLRELGEDRLIEKIAPGLPSNRAVIRGAGDDCAIVRAPGTGGVLVLKTDCVVENVHFLPDAKPSDVGWKAMARPLSDFAAAAATPQFALVTLMAPPTTAVAWLSGVYRGLTKAARRFDVAMVGGETSATAGPAAISVSIAGSAPEDAWVGRSGAKPGDELFVTGRLGGSIRGKHLRFVPRLRESHWLTKHFAVRAMMDLSDGLGADLPRLARASNVGFEVDELAIPRTRGCTVEQAISDGEDYELLFAIARPETDRLQAAWPKMFPKLQLTRIGRLVRATKNDKRKLPRGYVHFR
jgi:thiamine-monophosphate kinase